MDEWCYNIKDNKYAICWYEYFCLEGKISIWLSDIFEHAEIKGAKYYEKLLWATISEPEIC